jgi:hypothetical protein
MPRLGCVRTIEGVATAAFCLAGGIMSLVER